MPRGCFLNFWFCFVFVTFWLSNSLLIHNGTWNISHEIWNSLRTDGHLWMAVRWLTQTPFLFFSCLFFPCTTFTISYRIMMMIIIIIYLSITSWAPPFFFFQNSNYGDPSSLYYRQRLSTTPTTRLNNKKKKAKEP